MKNFTLGACILSAALASSAFGKPIYLKADATGAGDGSSWANAYTAVTDAITALNASEDSPAELRVAGGFYPVPATQTISHPDFVVRGGYRAADDGDEIHDSELYRTIFSVNTRSGWQQYWAVYDPIEQKTISISPQVKIVTDGKLTYPDESLLPNKYSFFITGNGNNSDKITVFSVDATGGGIFADATLTGVKDVAVFSVTANGPGTIITNCLVTGCRMAGGGAFSLGATVKPSKAIGCVVRYNNSAGNAGGASLGSGASLEGCLFDGNLVGASYNSCLIDVGAANNVVSNCTFVRTYSCVTRDTYHQSYNGTAAILRNKNNNFLMTDCLCVSNVVRTYGTDTDPDQFGQPLINARSGRFLNCLFEANLGFYRVVGGRSYSMFVDPVNGANGAVFSNCVFRANRLAATEQGSTEGEYALTVLGTGTGTSYYKAIGCVFDSNEMVPLADAPEGLTAVLCRGTLAAGVTAGATAYMTVQHCTFTGPKTNFYDYVQWGATHTKESYLKDSLFQDDGVAAAGPLLIQTPTYNGKSIFNPANVTIQNMTVQPTDYIIAGLAYDKVPLNADYEPLARTPKLMETTDGEPRGARPLAEGVAEKKSITVRCEPMDAGSVTTPSTQTVGDDGSITAVTATSTDGGVFVGWFYEGETEPFSKSPTLTAVDIDTDRVIGARFSTQPVTVIFSLDGKGTFAATGTDKFEVQTSAGMNFPDPPTEFTIDDDWVFSNWKVLPAKVPGGDDEYVAEAKIVTKDVRVVYLSTTGAGAKDGTSWGNAYGDLNAAYADAGLWRGEVWAKEGVYKVMAAIDVRPNVAIRGGFAGTETTAGEANPITHQTIFTGDLGLDDYWMTNGSKKTSLIIENGKINLPEDEEDDPQVVWQHVFSSSPTSVGFTDANTDIPATNVSFSGVQFVCFEKKAVQLKATSSSRFEKCGFIGCGKYGTKGEYGTVSVSGEVLFKNCRFTGNFGTLSIGSTAKTYTNIVDGCRFEHGYSVYSTCGISINGESPIVITNTIFRRNCALGNNYYSSPASAVGVVAAATVGLQDCVFEKNRNEGTAIATVMARHQQSHLMVERCRFVANGFKELNAKAAGYNMNMLSGSAGISSHSYGSLVVKDTLFENNSAYVKVSNPANLACGYASAIGVAKIYDGTSAMIVNCAFIGNSMVDETEGDIPYPVGTVTTGYSGGGIALAVVNSVFRDNIVTSPHIAADIALTGSETETATFLNDILWSSVADYLPFAFKTPVTPQLRKCVVKNFDVSVFAESDQYSFCDGVSQEDPDFRVNPEVGVDWQAVPKVSPVSVAAKEGVPVYIADNGKYYYKDIAFSVDKPWRGVLARSTSYAEVSGIDEASEPIKDMFGASRVRAGRPRITYGPVNAEPLGLMLLVR